MTGTDTSTWFKNRSFGLAFSGTLIFSALYLGIASFSIGGLIGFTVLNFVLLAVLENLIRDGFGLWTDHVTTLLTACIGLAVAICIRIDPGIIDNAVAICAIALVMVILVAISFVRKASSKEAKAMILLVSAGLILATAFIVLSTGAFTPDTFSYYDIARTTFNDYGNTGMIRQYVTDSVYNCSFPYMFPFLIFITDKLTGLGTYSGVFVDFYVMLFSILVINTIGKKITSSCISGSVASFLMLTSPYLLDEVCAARTIPVAFFFVLTAMLGFVMYFGDEDRKAMYPLLIGAFLGLAMCTRFDNISAAAYCGAVFILLPQKRIRNLICYVTGLAVTVSPWVIYSLIRFGKVWATDNGGTLFLVEATTPTRIVAGEGSGETLFTAPSLWFKALLGKAGTILFNMSSCSLASNLLVLIGIVACIWIIAKRKPSKKAVAALCTVVLFYVLKTCMYILVGYPDERYHAETVIIVPFALLMFMAVNKTDLRAVKMAVLCLVMSCVTIVLYYFMIPSHFSKMVPPTDTENCRILSTVDVPREFLKPYLERMEKPDIEKDKALLVLGYSYEFARWADIKVYAEPDPMDGATVKRLLELYPDIGYVLVPEGREGMEWLGEKHEGEAVGESRLYKVER
ncbi:MAG: glycosyltransferase family 39 protein [Ruminococcaceae bacterium]|nr:glycosyltransferase family 39 protein [Oscillospiraceae bacterium]